MAMKRKMVARRPRRKYARRAMAARPVRGLRPMGVFNLTRTFWQGTWTPSTTATNDFWRYLTMNMGSLGWATDLGLVFDMYKINALKFTLRPRFDNFAGNDTTDTTLPGSTAQGLTQVHVINDPYSTLGPVGTYTTATLNTFLENGKVRSHQGTRPINIYIRNPTYSETVQASISAKSRARWVNWTGGGQGLVYGGAHVFLNDVALTGNFNQAFDIFVTVYLQCKGVV